MNKSIELKITDINYEGMGIATYNNKTVFVERALKDEVVLAEIDFENKNFYRAHTTKVIQASKDRIIPPCATYEKCGGCQLLHAAYQKTLEYKLKTTNNTLKRIGKVDFEIKEILGMAEVFPYRNKVQIPVTSVDNKLVCGYFERRTHNIIPFKTCLLQSKQVDEIIIFIKNIFNEFKISGYNENSHEGILRHIMIRENKYNQIMIVLVINDNKLKCEEEIKNKIINKYPNVVSIIINSNTNKNNVILGDKSYPLYGKDEIIDELLGFKYKISHYSFFQINRCQAEVLYKKVLEYVGNAENVVDAYCGVGTITLSLSKIAKYVYGIEVVAPAIDNANENKKLNNVENVEFILGKVEDKIFDLLERINIDCVVIDPPRKGLDVKVIEALKQSKIKRIVYVSCNPSSFARDIDLLKEDYEIKKATLVDMFAYTTGVECVALLERK